MAHEARKQLKPAEHRAECGDRHNDDNHDISNT